MTTLTILAAAPGFSFADSYAIGLLFIGVAFCAAIGALSHQHDRAFSASVIYLALGLVASVGIFVLDGVRVDPVGDAKILQRITELALVVAVFTAGLKIERRLRWAEWRAVVVLLVVVMPATIALIALFGTQVMGLSLGAALVLGAVLAPTDPVLAGDLGIAAPGEQADEPEDPEFALSAEAGLNDGLAFPFVLLAIFVAGQGGTDWIGEWVLADLLFALVVGAAAGAAGGYGLAALVVPLRARELLRAEFDGFVAIAAPLLLYAAAEILGGYGLLAAFVGGAAFRRYEFGHSYNRRIHDGAEMVEKFFELAVILLLGSMVTLTGLGEPGVAGWLLAPVLLLLIRPVVVMLCFARSAQLRRGGRLFVAWFGVRGVAALFYAAFVVEAGVLSSSEEAIVVWTAAACVMASIVVHGVTATPFAKRALAGPQGGPPREDRGSGGRLADGRSGDQLALDGGRAGAGVEN